MTTRDPSVENESAIPDEVAKHSLRKSWSRQRRWQRLIVSALSTLLIAVTLLPLYWMVRTSLSTPTAIVQNPRSFLPPEFTFNNFLRVLGFVTQAEARAMGGSGMALGFFSALRNTIYVTAVVTVSQVFFSACAAYAFARLRFPFRNTLFTMYLSGLMIPAMVVVIPNFALIRDLGWMNTFAGIMAPFFFMTPIAVFFMRQFFLSVNTELEESAYLDGAGHLTAAFRIVFPISMPAMLTCAIIVSTAMWNQYLWMLVVGRHESVRVLTVALAIFRQQVPEGAPDWGGLMAGTMLATVPIAIIFLILGKHVINALGHTGFR